MDGIKKMTDRIPPKHNLEKQVEQLGSESLLPDWKPDFKPVPCPQISTYQHVNGPIHASWLAKFATKRKTKTGTTVIKLLPLEFYGRSEEDVVDSATAWWDEQQDKERNKVTSVKKFQESRKQNKEPQ